MIELVIEACTAADNVTAATARSYQARGGTARVICNENRSLTTQVGYQSLNGGLTEKHDVVSVVSVE